MQRSSFRSHSAVSFQGRCECGGVALVGCGEGPELYRLDGDGWVRLGTLLPGPTTLTCCDCPSVRAGPRVRGRCLGSGGGLPFPAPVWKGGYVWYFLKRYF